MMFPNPDLYKRIAEERMRDCLRQAEVRRLLREAGIDQRGWMARQSCRLLCQLGHLLVALGRRLERYEASPVESGVAWQMNDIVR